jgi:hypothetical protein
MKNYYKLLGINNDATEAEIKKAYRELSVKYHPDSNLGDKNTEEIMKEINEAYHTLKDKTKKAEYDFYFKRYYTSEEITVYKDKKTNSQEQSKNYKNISPQKLTIKYLVAIAIVIFGLLIIVTVSNSSKKVINKSHNDQAKLPFQNDKIRYEIWDHCYCKTIGNSNPNCVFRIVKNGKLGIAFPDSSTMIEPIYDELTCPSEDGYITVTKNHKDGVINLNNQIVIPIEYDELGYVNEGLVTVNINGRTGVLNLKNELIIPAKYSGLTGFSNRRAFVKKIKKYALITNDGKILTDFIFDDVYPFKLGFAAVRINRKWGYIDTNGATIIPFDYAETVSMVYDELKFAVKKSKDSKWIFVDINNEVTTKPEAAQFGY